MDRRRFLQALGVGTLGALSAAASGCAASSPDAASGPTTAVSPPRTQPPTQPLASPSSPATPVLQRGAPRLAPIAPPETVITWVPDDPPLVALTVDDGISSPVVRAYVELAKATGIRLTFFANAVNPSWSDNAALMRPLVDSGQIQIANHTYDHPDITLLAGGEIGEQLRRNDAALRTLYGVGTVPYFRPPFMAHDDGTDAICVDEGYSVITWWTGSFGDSTEITQAQVLQNARDYLHAGTIVIGHANFPAVTTVFDDIIELIATRGLTTVTLADVFDPAAASG